MAHSQTDNRIYYNINNPSTNDPTYEELQPLNTINDDISREGQNTISQDYDDVAPESRYPPTRMQAIPHPDARVGGPPSPHPHNPDRTCCCKKSRSWRSRAQREGDTSNLWGFVSRADSGGGTALHISW